MAALGLCCYLSVLQLWRAGLLSSCCCGRLITEGSLVEVPGLQGPGSIVVACGPSCPAARGIFLDQGLNWCPLHRKADSQPLGQQGSPIQCFFDSRNTSVCSVCIYGIFGSPDKKNRQFPDKLQPLIWLFLKWYLPCVYTLCNVTAPLSLRGGAGFLSLESGRPCDPLWSVACSSRPAASSCRSKPWPSSALCADHRRSLLERETLEAELSKPIWLSQFPAMLRSLAKIRKCS